jgi:CBS domain-containing protein
MRARDIMTRSVITVFPDATVKYAAGLLASHGFTALPVVDHDDRLVGIVTEVDLIRDRFPTDTRNRRYTDGRTPRVEPGTRVADVMTPAVIAMGATADVTDLIRTMWHSRIRSMPITDGARVVGIVTRRDLVRVLGRADDAIEKDVRHALEHYCGLGRWTVDVRNGVVSLGDGYEDETERHIAVVLAEGVPGVVAAHVAPSTDAPSPR